MRVSHWSSDVCSSDLDRPRHTASRSPPRDLDLRAILLPDRHPATMRCRVILKPGLRRAHDAIIPALDPDRATTTDRKDHMRKFATRSLAVLALAGSPALAATPQDRGFWQTPTIHGYGKIHYLPDGAYKPRHDPN